MLTETNLYSGVERSTGGKAGMNHFHFQFNTTGLDFDTFRSVTLLSAMSLTLISVWSTTNVDSSMFYLVNGSEVESASAPETQKSVIWLPAAIPGMIFSTRETSDSTVDSALKYFNKRIEDRKMY